MTDFTIVEAARKDLAANPQLSGGPAAQLRRFLALEDILIGFSEGIDGPRLEAGLTWAKHGSTKAGRSELIALFASRPQAAQDEGAWDGDPIAEGEKDLERLTAEALTKRAKLPTDEGGCVTKRFVIFTPPGEVPVKKGGWLKDEHLIGFLREVMLHDDWKPGFRATVLELTWDNDLWASSATEHLSMHDHAIGPRHARKAWQEARAKHEHIYKAAPKMKLGEEIDSYSRATAITTPPAPDAEKLRVAVEALKRIATVDMGGGFLGALACRQVADQALADLQ